MKHLALLALALLTVAAAPAPSGDAMIAMRQTGTVGPLSVRPLAVEEDSRCPSDNMCIWAGRIVLRVAVEGPGVRRTIVLQGHRPVAIAGGTLALVRTEPAKRRGKKLKPSAYRFGFAFKARPDLDS